MKLTITKLVLKYLFSGFDSAVQYALDVLNAALADVPAGDRAKVQAALNVAKKTLSVLGAMSWLCPVKWQTAYGKTIDAVAETVKALEDLSITVDELKAVRDGFAAAVAAWKSPDDETCVE